MKIIDMKPKTPLEQTSLFYRWKTWENSLEMLNDISKAIKLVTGRGSPEYISFLLLSKKNCNQ